MTNYLDGTTQREDGTLVDIRTRRPIIWTYWEGEVPPIIQLCVRSIEKYNPEFRLVTPETLPDEALRVREEFIDLPKPQISDLLRLWLIKQYGGLWVDSDNVCLGPLTKLQDQLTEETDLLGVFNRFQGDGDHILATPFGAAYGSQIIDHAYVQCKTLLEKMKQGQRVPYGSTSVGLLTRCWREFRNNPSYHIKRFQHYRWNRIGWKNARVVYNRTRAMEAHEFSNDYTPGCTLYHLTNPITDQFRDATEDQIIESRTFLGFLLAKANSVIRYGITQRTYECISRIPITYDSKGIEIGVFKGLNAGQILQQRPQTKLILVDPYGLVPASEDYRRTNDPKARIPIARFNNIYNEATERLRVYGDRAMFIRIAAEAVAGHIQERSLDYGFIDGDHSRSGCAKDLDVVTPLIKEGGWIGGHDYNQKKFPGVVAAVDAKFGKGKVETGLDSTWFVQL